MKRIIKQYTRAEINKMTLERFIQRHPEYKTDYKKERKNDNMQKM